jgi:predicted metalloprotease with PDZ domain
MNDPATPIRYRIRPSDPDGHLFEVELDVDLPAIDGQRFALPAWIPGSYMIREFARHIVRIEGRRNGRRVKLEKLDKHTWRAPRGAAPLTLRYLVYAWDLSVRAAHLDRSHGFFNGTSVFLRVIGQESHPCVVDIEPARLAGLDEWRVATTLPRAGAPEHGFGRYRAASYDELIDHPVEMGTFDLVRFEACGVPHEVAITGRHDTDGERLASDLAAVCSEQIRMFEPESLQAPFDRYLFLTMAIGDGYGGLEHRASTALICARNDLPWRGMRGVPDGYRTFLGLASHEYFHSWHVKRIKPQAFAPYDLERENHSRLLWIFEGFTSYYDDLLLLRAGVIGTTDYLKSLGSTISQVLRGPGRQVQSVAESSFDAWTKYYRQDENSPNAIVSYYTKGALVALCLDLGIRIRTEGRKSLDDVMRLMWQRFGSGFEQHGRGLDEDGFAAIVQEATGLDLAREIQAWSESTAELPLARLLSQAGVRMETRGAEPDSGWLGARLQTRGGDLVIATALSDGPAHRGGLSSGDVLVAADGLRVTEKSLKTLLERRPPGSRIRIHAFRRDELIEREITLSSPPETEAGLTMMMRPSPAAARIAKGWLRRS